MNIGFLPLAHRQPINVTQSNHSPTFFQFTKSRRVETFHDPVLTWQAGKWRVWAVGVIPYIDWRNARLVGTGEQWPGKQMQVLAKHLMLVKQNMLMSKAVIYSKTSGVILPDCTVWALKFSITITQSWRTYDGYSGASSTVKQTPVFQSIFNTKSVFLSKILRNISNKRTQITSENRKSLGVYFCAKTQPLACNITHIKILKDGTASITKLF